MKKILVSMLIALCSCGVLAAQESATVWVTMGEDVYKELARAPEVFSIPFDLESFGSDSGVVITRLRSRDLAAVSAFIHTKTPRCSGYIVHDSLAEAEAAVENAASGSYLGLPSSFAIDQQTLVNQLMPDLAEANILSTITHLSTAYNNRYYLNASGEQSALWIRDLWQGYATGRSDVTVTTYSHSGYVQPSVILTIDGATLPDEVVVLGAHLDSIQSGANNSDPATLAPGADDDASGIATLSEVVRVLMENGVTPDRTVKFMGYAAEEVGLRGSGDIAADHAAAGIDVVAVMQMDMTDYNGSVEDIVLIDDYTNTELTSFVIDLVTTYQPTLGWTYTTCGYACSDHASWTNEGFAAAFPFEARFGEYNPTIHTVNDTVATLGNSAAHALKFAQVGLAFAIETGMADCTPAAVADAGADRTIDEGDSTTIGTPAVPNHTYSWSPGGATSAEVVVSPTTTTTYTVTATTSCGSAQDSVDVTVIPAGGGGPQTAVYDAGLGAPACAVVGSSCDSTTLLDGRAGLGPEPDQPNTLDTCSDGTSGSYHSDESNDKIVVSTLDSADFSAGATVQVDATVYAWSTGTSDHLDLYWADDANSPTWNLITTIDLTSGGLQTLSAQYTLGSGALQAVRANFRYNGSPSPCSGGSYDDHDDLVFAVSTGPECTIDDDCDDGDWCNGAEACNAGSCEAGTAPDCSDGVGCTDDACNETTDACDNTANDANCDNGDFCDGAETCDVVNDCQAGTAPSCDDGVGCTDDACNETTDACDNVANNSLCDNGAFCDGSETCDAVNDCQPGTPPAVDDGVGCTDDSCDEVGDVVVHTPNDGLCDNGAFCDGAETCDVVNDCQAGTAPSCDDGVGCTDDACNETTDACDNVANNSLCDNGAFCDGSETCDAVNDCQASTPPAVDDGVGCTDDSCDEVGDVVVHTPNDGLCDNGAFCDGAETCDAVNDCQAGSDPCPGQSCDEGADVCVGGSNPVLYMSFRATTSVPGVGNVADEDVVSYDEVTGTWVWVFDGSDVGLGSFEIDGLAILPSGNLLLSFRQSGTVGGVTADDSDVVEFAPTSLGSTTAGTFSLYFDGSDVGLTANGEDVDGIALNGAGQLLVSTQGGFSGTGASGADEDLFLFTGTLGASTSGSFSLYFDGSDVGLGGVSAEDVDAAAFTTGGNLLFSTVGSFSVTGLSGADEDVAEFAGTYGGSTAGSFSMRQDLSAIGIDVSEDVGSLYIVE